MSSLAQVKHTTMFQLADRVTEGGKRGCCFNAEGGEIINIEVLVLFLPRKDYQGRNV